MISSNIRPFKALLVREYWEHKGAMFYTPAFIACFFALVLVLASFTSNSVLIESDSGASYSSNIPQAVDMFEKLEVNKRNQGVQIGLYAPMTVFGFVMLIVSFFYALGSLFDERKDRSILFWKSLPISDTSSVLSKFVSICISIPILYFIVVAVFQLFVLFLGTVVAWFGGSLGLSLWSSSNFFIVMINSLFSLIVASLWLAPVWAWLMLASSWAKKNAFLWGILPIFLLAFAEGWLFHSNRLLAIVGLRIAESFTILNSQLNGLVGGEMFSIPSNQWFMAIVSGEFWMGLIVASLFLGAAVKIRGIRDEA